MNLHLVHHKRVGAGYAQMESDGRWVVRFFRNYARHHVFPNEPFKRGFLEDCGVTDLGENNEQF